MFSPYSVYIEFETLFNDVGKLVKTRMIACDTTENT